MTQKPRAESTPAPTERPNSKKEAQLLIHPIGELATPTVSHGPGRGVEMHRISRITDGAIAVSDGRVLAAGPADEVFSNIVTNDSTVRIDASDKLVTPGLIDPHTHLIFGGNRADEFIMRCQGKTYSEIAEAGGGIVASMKATRNSTVDDLTKTGLVRLNRMLAAGTTTCEVKTGYGLSEESELIMLQSIYQLKCLQPVEVIPTFMPAHAIPPGVSRQTYVGEIVDRMLPRAADFCRSHALPLPFIDVFCDKGYFDLDDTRAIFEAALRLGFKTKVHADEFANLGATKLATELSCLSADHLLNVSDQEIELLAQSNTVAVLLPGTSFYLNLAEHAPARKMIDRGVAVALGSDFNPGSCHIFSLPLIWGLACLHLKMTAEEALTALTLNAAHSLGLGKEIGQLLPGYKADITVYDVQSLEEVPYNLGWNPVSAVIKQGKVVSSR